MPSEFFYERVSPTARRRAVGGEGGGGGLSIESPLRPSRIFCSCDGDSQSPASSSFSSHSSLAATRLFVDRNRHATHAPNLIAIKLIGGGRREGHATIAIAREEGAKCKSDLFFFFLFFLPPPPPPLFFDP